MKITNSDFENLGPCHSARLAYKKLNSRGDDINFNRDVFRKLMKAYEESITDRDLGYGALFGLCVWLHSYSPYVLMYNPCRLKTKDSKKVMESKMYHAVKKYLTENL